MNIFNISDSKNFMNDQKCVFVSGVTGQDGSYMVDYLLKNTNYMIFGGARRLSVINHNNLKHLEGEPRFKLINFDLTDTHSISKTIETIKPDYFINFAAQTFVASSWDFPAQTWECNSTAIIHILEAIQKHIPTCRFYNAGSSEEFGNVIYTPQDEKHPARPRSPYGASKCAARQLVKVYRESYNLYAIQGLLFNHESERRGIEFVTRKITTGVARITTLIENNALQKTNNTITPIELGNIYTKRDWSHSKDFIDGIWKMLNQKEPKEYVLSSNESHSIKEFIDLAFKFAGYTTVWRKDKNNKEECYIYNNYYSNPQKLYKAIIINEKYYRPAEIMTLQGNSNLARKELNWKPNINFNKLVELMVKSDLKKAHQSSLNDLISGNFA